MVIKITAAYKLIMQTFITIPTTELLAISTNVNDSESLLAVSKSLIHNTEINAYNYCAFSPNLKNVSVTFSSSVEGKPI
jgi:hypothetical protein